MLTMRFQLSFDPAPALINDCVFLLGDVFWVHGEELQDAERIRLVFMEAWFLGDEIRPVPCPCTDYSLKQSDSKCRCWRRTGHIGRDLGVKVLVAVGESTVESTNQSVSESAVTKGNLLTGPSRTCTPAKNHQQPANREEPPEFGGRTVAA